MKCKKLLILAMFSLVLTGCNYKISLYTPNESNIVDANESNTGSSDNTKISVINESNYTGTIKYADDNQTKLSSEEVYSNGLTSTVYIIASNSSASYLGSGVFFSEDIEEDGYAYLFTNAHLVYDATSIEIIYSNYKRDTALLVGYHRLEDVAVLKVKKNDNYTIATLKTSDKLEVASEVVTIGTPIATDYSFVSTKGVISKIDSPLTSTVDSSYNLLLLQIDATLNSGNSGGPLFDMYGNLIGLNTMALLYDSSYEEIDHFNFAIPIERAVFIANKIFNNIAYSRGTLGISIYDIVDLSLTERQTSNISLDYGLYVSDVSTTGASYNLLKTGDIITKINNKEFTTRFGFQKELYNYSVNEEVTLTVYRNNQYLDINITLK